MRVALFPSAYAPALGGVEELTARLGARLQASGHTAEVWVNRWPADLPETEVIAGLRVRRFGLALPAMKPAAVARFSIDGPRALARLRAAGAQLRPDVIHVQCFSVNGIYATLLAQMTGARLVITLQGETVMDDHDVYDHSALLRRGLRSGLAHADVVTGCSQFVLDDAVARFGLAPGRGVVIPNGVEPTEDVEPEPLELPFARFVLAYGRVVEKKGFDLLLAAFARLAAAHPDVGLVIGGEGAARPALEAQVAQLGLEGRVSFPGRLSRGRVAWATAAAELFVLPSRVEPFGIVVLEAMRAGLAVVVSDRGGATDMVRDGVEGLVVDPTDVPALAAAIGRVLSDHELAARLGEAGGRRWVGYQWEAVTQRYLEAYVANDA